MGIFEFVKDQEREGRLDNDVEQGLAQEFTAAGLELQDFEIRVIGSTALLSGLAGSLKDAELARLIAGNHAGIDRVNDDGLIVLPDAIPAKMVTVREGDTLSKIAKDQLGHENRERDILEANHPMLRSGKEIFPGQVLRVPVDGLSLGH